MDENFYDVRISIVQYTCPYCGEAIQEELVQCYLSGDSIQCIYCNVKIQIHDR
jgi:predicted RNA-binding Zn-ribbon protein involved in translation (DUF1610 family)